jgi:hypothetical protein
MTGGPHRPSPKASWRAFVWIVLVPLAVMFVVVGGCFLFLALREGV